MKIDASNYFLVSEGVFSAQPKGWVEKARASTKSTASLRLGNRVWRPITKTGRLPWDTAVQDEALIARFSKGIFHPGDAGWEQFDAYCSSFYWVSEDGTHLMRLSNHWSAVEVRVEAFTCGNVARCWWSLRTQGRNLRKGEWHLGIIAFCDMR